MSRRDDSGMTLKDAITQFIVAIDPAEPQLELLERVLNPPAERDLAARIPLYPPKTAKRASLCELRWRHLDHVDDMARRNTDRAETMTVFLRNYEYFFGRLRKRRRDEVPSDELRKFFIVSNILDQVDARRAELEEEAAYRDSK
jgi:hypothetical protein